MSKEIITQSELKLKLEYNSDTGIFTKKTASGGSKIGSIAGTKRNDGYIQISINNYRYCAHRLAWLYEYGEFPKNYIDHINGNPEDNRLCNLREATNQQNVFNSKLRKDNTSGIKGVIWDKSRNSWKAQIFLNGKCFNLGRYANIEDAESVVNKARLNLHNEFARFK
jgi:hypothetical protein